MRSFFRFISAIKAIKSGMTKTSGTYFENLANIKRTPSQRSFYMSVNGVAVSGEVS